MKLLSMTDFILQGEVNGIEPQVSSYQLDKRVKRLSAIINYAKFLKQPLMLGMFIPCDKNGIPLKEPTTGDAKDMPRVVYEYKREYYLYDLGIYNEAKSNVLFDHLSFVKYTGRDKEYVFEMAKSYPLVIDLNKDIEYLISELILNVDLTEFAINKIYN